MFMTYFKLLCFFIVGACVAGVVTNRKERRTRFIGALCVLSVGCVLLIGTVLGVKVYDFRDDLQCLCGLCMGFQNAALCAITAFSRTTHVTGNMANVGICLGQASNPAKVTTALLFKLKANAVLTLTFLVGVIFHMLLSLIMSGTARWLIVPAIGLILLALVEIFFDNAGERAETISASSTPGSGLGLQADELEILSELACAGGFTDTCANLPYHADQRKALVLPTMSPGSEIFLQTSFLRRRAGTFAGTGREPANMERRESGDSSLELPLRRHASEP